MGTTLLGTQINNTYPGLLKTADNAVLGATEKIMGDGLGNDSTLSLGTASASFSGTLDLSGATVTGLPTAAGLILGTGTATQEGAPLSMASGPEVTTIAALARGGGDIAIGENAKTKIAGTTWPSDSIAIGHNAETTAEKAMAIGRNATNTGEKGLAIGYYATAAAAATAVGQDARAYASASVAVGKLATVSASSSNAVSVGNEANSQFGNSVAIGFTAKSFANNGIALGYLAKCEPFGGSNSIAIGSLSLAQANGAVAIGANVTAQKSDTVTVKKLETLDPGEGIIMHSPNGTEYKVTVSDAGALVVTAV